MTAPTGAYVYMLLCRDGSYYVGSTRADWLETRIGEHEHGTYGGYTAARRPVVLVWSEHFERITDAIAAERRIKRAVATRIAADTSAGGFILPNDHVDVIMTRRAEGAPSGYVTETILNNVRVLAIDQTIEEKDGQKVVVGQTATLELSPEQAEILTVAQQMGERLTLALRSLADAQRQPGEERLDAKHLVGGAKREGWITVYRAGNARQVSRGE